MTFMARKAHFVLTAELEGHKIRAIIDCGANTNYVSRTTAKKLKLQEVEKENPYPLLMADGSLTKVNNGKIDTELRQVKLSVSLHQEEIDLNITDIKYNVVLGMGWLGSHNPIINWKERIL